MQDRQMRKECSYKCTQVVTMLTRSALYLKQILISKFDSSLARLSLKFTVQLARWEVHSWYMYNIIQYFKFWPHCRAYTSIITNSISFNFLCPTTFLFKCNCIVQRLWNVRRQSPIRRQSPNTKWFSSTSGGISNQTCGQWFVWSYHTLLFYMKKSMVIQLFLSLIIKLLFLIYRNIWPVDNIHRQCNCSFMNDFKEAYALWLQQSVLITRYANMWDISYTRQRIVSIKLA